jgi:hypothetical protein
MKRARLAPVSVALLTVGLGVTLGACSSVDDPTDSSGDLTSDAYRKKHHPDAGVPDAPKPPDAGVPDAGGGGGGGDDGTPVRLPCTSSLGSALGSSFGRLDGRLVSLVPPGTSGCNSDSHHLHLQVQANGGTYDVAVNFDDKFGGEDWFLDKDMAMNLSFAEGWHGGLSNDYPTLGVHSGDFTRMVASDLLSTLESTMANANHVSIYMTPYGPGGGHDIHRHLNGTDGAIVLDPLAPVSHVLMFHFDNQSF